MDGHVYITTLSGRITALNASDGHILWAKNLPSRTESSPLPLNGTIYFGSEDGTVYALRRRATAASSGPTTRAAT